MRLVQTAAALGRELRGWEVDREASALPPRSRLRRPHPAPDRATASAVSVHGEGVNMDDYETHDDRRLLPGTGFTIEPGVYFPDFGVRSEINMIVGTHDAVVTGPLQTEILALV